MSLRSATRLARPALARAVPRAGAQVVPRRMASTAPKKGGDATWMMGSAVVFGGLAAYLLMPSSKHAAHSVHENIDKKASGEKAGVITSEAVPGVDKQQKPEDAPTPAKERASVNASVKSDAPKSADSEGGKDEDEDVGAGADVPSKKDQSSAPGGATGRPADNDRVAKPDTSEDKSASTEPAGGDQPEGDSVKSSIVRAEKTDAPLVAEAEGSTK
ncbi:hypothetical protein EHS25_005097 [Saitozyma podzolica]|uniref:Uncharacterized protein n=1 Tax=Saitozyma podzolica TaxID=1890683 RepID=A0A427Y2I2_9TREE|nr:hypothetical protein EHS25_005097 [Saitozyma podzolica]